MSVEVICIGASAGGIQALQKLLKSLGKDFKTPLLVVLHIPEHSKVSLSTTLQNSYHGTTLDAVDKLQIENSHCYIAPPGYHLLVEEDKSLALSQEDPIKFSRPSIDVLFESAALAFRSKVCGIILTGANSDGADGLKAVKDAGGIAIVQDPTEADYPTMPQASVDVCQPDSISKLDQMSIKLQELL